MLGADEQAGAADAWKEQIAWPQEFASAGSLSPPLLCRQRILDAAQPRYPREVGIEGGGDRASDDVSEPPAPKPEQRRSKALNEAVVVRLNSTARALPRTA